MIVDLMSLISLGRWVIKPMGKSTHLHFGSVCSLPPKTYHTRVKIHWSKYPNLLDAIFTLSPQTYMSLSM